MKKPSATTRISWLEKVLLTLMRQYISYASGDPQRLKQQRQWWPAVVVLSVSCGAVLHAVVRPALAETSSLLIFIIPVLVSSWYGGFKAGSTATVVSALANIFLFSPPPRQFADVVPIVFFGIAGILISLLNETLQRITDQGVRTLETISDGFIAVNAEWQVQYINDIGQKFLKYSWQELQGRPLTDAWPEAAHPLIYKQGRAALREYRAQKFEEFYPQLNKWFEVNIYPSVQGLTIYLNDITRYKVIEQEQERSHALLQAVVEGTSDAVYVKNLEGRYLLINKAGARLLGRTAAEVIDRTDTDIFTPETAQKIKAGEAKVMQTGQQLTYEEEGTAAGRTRTYWSSKGPLRNQQGHIIGIAGISSDITERKKFEQRKDEFISIASHELKTPLTSLRLFISILEKALVSYPEPAVHDYLKKINLQTNRLARLVADLLDISKIRAGKLEFRTTTFDLNEVITENIEVIQASIKQHTINLSGHITRPVFGDPDRIGQVFINLLNNAIKYSPQATIINVELSQTPQAAVVSVQDFGIGITSAAQTKIFDRFYQVPDAEDTSHRGLGMGLYIAQEIIKRHSGTIRVQSQPGAGSTFSFTLPFAATAHDQTTPSGPHR